MGVDKYIFTGVNTSSSKIGDVYYDTNDNTYKYNTKDGAISIDYSSTLTTISSNNWIDSTSGNNHEREYIKDYLKNDPELFNELLLELRKEKINKLKQ